MQNYLDLTPQHTNKLVWCVRENDVVEIEMINSGFYNRIAQRFFKKPQVSCISLDKYGSKLWLNSDGKNTVFDLIKIMERSFPDENKMLERVIAFIRTLERNGFIYFT